MIKFITEETDKGLTFEQVEIHQFFISNYGSFCQKTDTETYVKIARKDGIPESGIVSQVTGYRPVNKIFPKVTKIEF